MLSKAGTIVAGLLMKFIAINYSVAMRGEDFNKSVNMLSFTDRVQQYKIHVHRTLHNFLVQ